MSHDLQKLNKEAIAAAKLHMGKPAWLTVAFIFFIAIGFVTNLVLFANGITPVWLATLLLAVFTYMSYTPMHEAAHSNINGTNEKLQWLNDLCGYIAAPMISMPYASHRYEHFTHHRYTNIPDKDPDFVISGFGQGIWTAFLTVFKFLWIQFAFFALNRWSTASLKEKVIYCLELTFSIGWRVTFITLVDQPLVSVVVLVGYIAGALFTSYWFAYRPHLPYKEPKRYQNTNSLIMPKWMKPFEWFWLGQNLHSIHHLFPRVPFYRYHALHREIEPILRAHGTPIVGIFSREAISEEKSSEPEGVKV